MPTIPKSTLDFLTQLRENNNRDWFNEHKSWYQEEYARMVEFAEAVQAGLEQTDQLEPRSGKQILFRIYRDVRFSKDKSPYKPHFSGGLKRASVWRRGGYYFHVEPGASFVGGGFWAPNSDDLKRIRQEIAADPRTLRQLIADPVFVKTFGALQGEQLKTAPQGYAQDHPAIDLLRYKQFLISRRFSDREVLQKDFLDQVVQTFVHMHPFFDYMSEVLTTDENGVPRTDLE